MREAQGKTTSQHAEEEHKCHSHRSYQPLGTMEENKRTISAEHLFQFFQISFVAPHIYFISRKMLFFFVVQPNPLLFLSIATFCPLDEFQTNLPRVSSPAFLRMSDCQSTGAWLLLNNCERIDCEVYSVASPLGKYLFPRPPNHVVNAIVEM